MTHLRTLWHYLTHPSPWRIARREHMQLMPWSRRSALRLILEKGK